MEKYWSRYDKTVHVLVSASLAWLLRLLFPWAVVLPSVVAVGVAKELYDRKWRRQRFDPADVLADLAGIGAIFLLEQAWQGGISV